LTVFEGAKSIQYKGFAGSASRTQSLVEKKAMSAEALAEALNRRFRNMHLTADLSEPGAGHQAVEEWLEEIRSPEPIARRKGL